MSPSEFIAPISVCFKPVNDTERQADDDASTQTVIKSDQYGKQGV
jgi:hypothetical protein